MMRTLLAAFCCAMTPALADVPQVVTDIAPVRAIVARVMEGAGTPSQIIPTAASPHGYAMRPSEARALSQADLVVWVGPVLTGWLEGPIESLAPDAAQLVLMETAGLTRLGFREGAMFARHEHEETHGEDADHEDQGDDEEHAREDSGHAQGAMDPHLWLDPRNAQLWATAVAGQLAELDPAQGALYRENAAAFSEELRALEEEIAQILAPVQERPFLVLHDGYHYFEARFGVEARGSVYLGDGRSPGPARLKVLRQALAASPVVCAFAEPQLDTGLLDTATEGRQVRIATLDPLGAQGASYADLLRGIATAMRACLEAE